MSTNIDRALPTQDSRYIASSTTTRGIRHAAGHPKHLRVFGGLLFLALSASLVGQTHFCIGGDVDHLTPANIAACENKLSAVRDAVKQHGTPSDWHFVVVCDEAGWKEYASFSSLEAGLLTGAGYSTDSRLHWTFLRGSDIDTAQPQTAASVVSLALESVPAQKNAPQLPASRRQLRQYSIAAAQHTGSTTVTP